MMPTHLETLIDQATSKGFISQITVHIERAGEDLAKDLLADPAFRAKLHRLMNAQVDRLLAKLEEPTGP